MNGLSTYLNNMYEYKTGSKFENEMLLNMLHQTDWG